MKQRIIVTYSDIIDMLLKIGANRQMIKNPYFSEGVFIDLLSNYYTEDESYVFGKATYDVEGKKIVISNDSPKTELKITLKSENSFIVSAARTVYDSSKDTFSSDADVIKIIYSEKENLPLVVRNKRMHHYLWNDKTQDTSYHIHDCSSSERLYDENGIECNFKEVRHQGAGKEVAYEEIQKYSTYELADFMNECKRKASKHYIEGYSNYTTTAKIREYADIMHYGKMITRNGVIEVHEFHDNIICLEQLHKLCEEDPYEYKNRVIGPKDEEELLEQISDLKAGEKIKKGLERYVNGRSQYCSKEYMSEEPSNPPRMS